MPEDGTFDNCCRLGALPSEDGMQFMILDVLQCFEFSTKMSQSV